MRIYFTHSKFWLFLTNVLLLSGTCLPWGSSVSQFSLCLPLRPKLMQRVQIFAGPWPHHFHMRLWASTKMSFVFVLWLISACVTLSLHTTCSILLSISADISGECSFPSSWGTMFGHRTKGAGKHRIPEWLSVSLVSGICRPVKTIDSWTPPKPLQ